MKSTCGTGIKLSKQTIYDIMSGKLSMKMLQDERAEDWLAVWQCFLKGTCLQQAEVLTALGIVFCCGCSCCTDKSGSGGDSRTEREILIDIERKL